MQLSDRRSKLADIRFQLMWNRLISVVEEQAQALIRTAFGASTREAGDLSAGFYDTQGRMLVQAVTGTPGHVNSMARSVGHVLAKFPLTVMTPGDVYILNDPWLGTGHLNDIVVVTPTYRRGRPIGLFACTLHVVDIGGLGMTTASRQIYEEGLYLPIVPLVQSGRLNEWLVDLISANVRVPIQVMGDIRSEIACNEVGVRRLHAMMDEFGLEELDALADHILTRTREASLEAIRRLPCGTWHNSMTVDGIEAPIELKAALRVGPDGIDVDFGGTSGVVNAGINVPLSYAEAYASFGVKCIVMPATPNNAASLSTIRISAPEGCILNAPHPAPVQGRGTIGQMLPDLIFGCLAQIVPDSVPAEGSSCLWVLNLSGGIGRVDADVCELRRATPFQVSGIHSGGVGARPQLDGLSATAFPSGVRNVPVEVTESLAPVLIRRKELRVDSGGAGLFRGGLGQVMEVQSAEDAPFTFAMNYDRVKFPARGRAGGHAGMKGAVRLGSGRILPGKGRVTVPVSDSVVVEMAGGGGYGNPALREPARVAEDVAQGFVSADAARSVYKVMFDAHGVLDLEATKTLRADTELNVPGPCLTPSIDGFE
jgi:N-methylhydantoinase B/oxoprolinase/acetone carboxylase alpha subunit